jgi:hypothetical protein
MSVHIRVYPQGMTAASTTNALVQNRVLAQQLQNQKQIDALELKYQNALYQQQLQMTQLQAQVQYGGTSQVQYGAYSPYAVASPYAASSPYASYGVAAAPYATMLSGVQNAAQGFFSGLGLGGFGLGNLF